MGGSGGSGSGGSGGGSFGGGAELNCSSLAFDAVVMSPDPAVVGGISLGAMCEVLLTAAPRQLTVFVRETGHVLGAITDRWIDLTTCIDGGSAYEAEVVELRPVRVRIRPRQPYRLQVPFYAHLVEQPSGTVLTNGERLDVVLDPAVGPVALNGASGEVVGRVIAEPVALPEALREQRAGVARVDDTPTGGIIITDS